MRSPSSLTRPATLVAVKGDDRTARIAWTTGVAIIWPLVATGAFHLAWGPSSIGHPFWFPAVVLLVASPGALAIAAADEAPRWRRLTGAAVATTSVLAVIGYGVWAFPNVGCGEIGTPAEAAMSLVPLAVVVGAGSGLTAWVGGRLAARYRRLGIPLAFVFGWAMLAVVMAGVALRSLSISCFGY